MANILLVDDDDLLVNGQSDFLRRAGHTVSTAGNGNEAMDLVASNDFDLVITDIHMPGKPRQASYRKLPALPEYADHAAIDPTKPHEGLETLVKDVRAELLKEELCADPFALVTQQAIPIQVKWGRAGGTGSPF